MFTGGNGLAERLHRYRVTEFLPRSTHRHQSDRQSRITSRRTQPGYGAMALTRGYGSGDSRRHLGADRYLLTARLLQAVRLAFLVL